MSSYEYWELPAQDARKGEATLSLKTANTIPKPSKGEVLIRVHAVSLNYRDLIITTNQYPLECEKGPLIPASDGAGEVIEVGEGVTKFKKSDRVAANFAIKHLKGASCSSEESASAQGGAVQGMMTQYKIIDASALVKIPSHLTFEEAATLPCAALTAWNSLFGLNDVPVLPGSTVVAIGTGGVSVFTAQFAIAAGAKVIITSSSDEKLEKVKALFTKEQLTRLHTINYKTTPDWDQEVLKISPEKVSHIVEVGGPGTLPKSFSVIKRGGVVADIGFVAQGENPPLAGLVLGSNAIFRGVLVGPVSFFEDMNTCIDLFGIKPLVDKVFEWKQAPDAYAYQWKQEHVGKIVIKV